VRRYRLRQCLYFCTSKAALRKFAYTAIVCTLSAPPLPSVTLTPHARVPLANAGAPHGASMLAALCSALVSARATDERVFAKLASVLLSVTEGGGALSVQTIAVYSNLGKAAVLGQKNKY
jgi:hypothetical protein